MSAPAAATCTDYFREPIRTGGDVHRCILPAVHVFAAGNDDSDGMPRDHHRCDCGAVWVDRLQVAEARAARAAEAGDP